jgi:hypothetical protein
VISAGQAPDFEGVVRTGGRLPVGTGLGSLVFIDEQHLPLPVREIKGFQRTTLLG